jgi:hypothetical protein
VIVVTGVGVRAGVVMAMAAHEPAYVALSRWKQARLEKHLVDTASARFVAVTRAHRLAALVVI